MAGEDQQAPDVKTGEWAVIVGGSDGLGAAFAHEAASRGMNCMLIARSPEKLQNVARAIESQWGRETGTAIIDLSDGDAANRVVNLTADLEVGLIVLNAGGDTVASGFLDSELAAWQALNRRNVDTLTALCHAFGRRFAADHAGAIIFVGSDAAFGGGGLLSGYSATKAYALNLGESLWAELRPLGVDVLYVVIGSTDTPHMRGVLEARGIPPESINLADPADIAGAAIDGLGQGPTLILTGPDEENPLRSARIRRQRVVDITSIMKKFYGSDGEQSS